MVVIKSSQRVSADTIHVVLYADSFSELSETIPEIPEGVVIEAGSIAYDKDGNLAVLDSEGTWNTVQ